MLSPFPVFFLKSRWLTAANYNFLVYFLIKRVPRMIGYTTSLGVRDSPQSSISMSFGLFAHISFTFQLNGIVCFSMSTLCCSSFSQCLSRQGCSLSSSSKAKPKWHFLREAVLNPHRQNWFLPNSHSYCILVCFPLRVFNLLYFPLVIHVQVLLPLLDYKILLGKCSSPSNSIFYM